MIADYTSSAAGESGLIPQREREAPRSLGAGSTPSSSRLETFESALDQQAADVMIDQGQIPMKFTLSWLKDHLDTEASLDIIAETLTRIGLEVEGIEDKAAALKPYVIARILTAEQHPNADRLRVCMVDTGAGSRCRWSAARRTPGPAS